MPDAIITSTESTFGTISGTFAADQSTISGTVTGIVAGTLSGSVGVPGPAGAAGAPGQGVPAGGTSGQYLQKTSGADYETDWVTVNFAAYAVKANNLSDLTNFTTARDNLALGTANTPTFAGVNVPGSGTSVANLGATFLTINQSGHGQFTIQPSQGIVFPNGTIQTTAFTGGAAYISSVSSPLTVTSGNLSIDLSAYLTTSTAASTYYPLTNPSAYITASALTPYLTTSTASATYQTLAGMSSYLTTSAAASTYQTLSGMSAYLTTASAATSYYPLTGNPSGFLTSAPVTSVAGRTGAITLSNTDISGLGTLSVVNDAPSDGSQYARKNGAWDIVSAGSSYISSVSSPLSVTSGNLTVDLSAYAPLASPVFTGDARAVTPTFGDNDTSVATTAFVQSALAGGTAVARNFEVEVRNQSGSTIAAGSIVYISGATGNKPLITLAQANNDANSAQTIGFVKTAIANNGTGYVIVRGELENIDTSALTEGVQLYLSPTTAGTWTTTKPSAPLHLVYVGIVIRAHPTLGTILVAVQNGYELGEIHDVALGTLANNDLLAYESSTDLWKNKTYSALGLLTSATAASTYAALSGATFTGLVGTVASTTTTAGLNVPHGTAPTSPVNGDIWTTTSGLFARINGLTAQFPTLGGSNTFTTTNTFTGSTLNLGTGTSTGTVSLAVGATTSGNTKTVNIGTAGVSGSTTNITIGSTTGTSTTTLQGITNGVTQTAGDSSLKLATTAFVTTADNLKANLASPTFTGTVTIPAGASITGYATESYVTSQGYITSSALTPYLTTSTAASTYQTISGMSSYLTTSTAASTYQTISGMSSYLTTASAASTYAPLASPALTGVPTAPTAANGTNTTQVATTAFVLANGGAVTSVAGRTGAVTLSTADISGLGTMATATAADYSTTTVANGLYYPLSSNPAGYLTSAPVTSVAGRTGAVTLAVADISGAAPLASPALTGTPTSTTAAVDTNTTQIATTAYVIGQSYLKSATASSTYAPLASPTFTGTPAAPTASAGTSTTQLATTAFVTTADNLKANLASPAFTGTPTAPTATAGTNTTQIATTAFVTAAIPTNNIKAWVNFNGTGTVAIRASMNVTSITDNGVGNYTVNFTTALADANYAAAGFAAESTFAVAISIGNFGTLTQTTSAFRFNTTYNGTAYDCTQVHMTIHR
jgi:hypothetical protein